MSEENNNNDPFANTNFNKEKKDGEQKENGEDPFAKMNDSAKNAKSITSFAPKTRVIIQRCGPHGKIFHVYVTVSPTCDKCPYIMGIVEKMEKDMKYFKDKGYNYFQVRNVYRRVSHDCNQAMDNNNPASTGRNYKWTCMNFTYMKAITGDGNDEVHQLHRLIIDAMQESDRLKGLRFPNTYETYDRAIHNETPSDLKFRPLDHFVVDENVLQYMKSVWGDLDHEKDPRNLNMYANLGAKVATLLFSRRKNDMFPACAIKHFGYPSGISMTTEQAKTEVIDVDNNSPSNTDKPVAMVPVKQEPVEFMGQKFENMEECVAFMQKLQDEKAEAENKRKAVEKDLEDERKKKAKRGTKTTNEESATPGSKEAPADGQNGLALIGASQDDKSNL